MKTHTPCTVLIVILSNLCLAGCGGGGSATDQPLDDPTSQPIDGLAIGNAPLQGSVIDGGFNEDLAAELGSKPFGDLSISSGDGPFSDNEPSQDPAIDEEMNEDPVEELGGDLVGGVSGDLEEKPLISNEPLQDPAIDEELIGSLVAEPGGEPGGDLSQEPLLDLPVDEQARYRVTLENFWGVEDFPQAFPTDAHLSLVGGATHSVAVSFWEVGEVASRGIEDMAETGRIDQLLADDVTTAIANGTADSMIDVREYTEAQIDGVPGTLTFDIEMNVEWPLVSLVTMLGPSPDWFVGVSGQSLLIDDNWVPTLTVDLPIYDGGTKSDITPVMGGPDIVPANPIGLVAYDPATGVYLASDEPQNIARITFDRID